MSVAPSWLDELDLDPASTWRRMGTRALGERPWLVVDERRNEELARKARLLDERRHDVFAPAPDDVAAEVLDLVDAQTDRRSDASDPLEAAARSVQEDLCLLRHRDGAWHLDAAALCFPSRWRLTEKLGRPLIEVHGPTPGYPEHLAARVDRMLDRLGERPVLRRNWFVHPDAALHQPDPDPDDPVIPATRVHDDLHLRSERQTLRRLPSVWILFTIRVQHDPLGVLLDDPAHRARFRRYLTAAPEADLTHRGMAPAQVRELRSALGITAPARESDTTSDL